MPDMRGFSWLMAATALVVACGGTAVIDADDGAGGTNTGTATGSGTGTATGSGTGTATGSGTGTATGSGTGTATGSGTGTATGSGTGTPAGTGTGEGNCFQLPGDQCFECLIALNPAGSQAYVQAFYDNCACTPFCQMACSMECSAPPTFDVSAPCSDCINEIANDPGTGCIDGFSEDCQSNPACINFLNDLQNCPF
jgi:hypothetical protein